jgi:hypothetical protein
VPILFLEPYPRPPWARLFDQHGAAADMNLRKVAVDERLDLCSIKATQISIVAPHSD